MWLPTPQVFHLSWLQILKGLLKTFIQKQLEQAGFFFLGGGGQWDASPFQSDGNNGPSSHKKAFSLVAQIVKNLPAMQETRVLSPGQEVPRRKAWQPPPVVLPGESQGHRSLVGYSPWVSEGKTRFSNQRTPMHKPSLSVWYQGRILDLRVGILNYRMLNHGLINQPHKRKGASLYC